MPEYFHEQIWTKLKFTYKLKMYVRALIAGGIFSSNFSIQHKLPWAAVGAASE